MKTRFIQTVGLAALVALATNLAVYSQALAPVQDTPDGPLYMPGEVLIQFKADATDQELGDVVRLAAVTSARQIHTPAMKARGNKGVTRAFTSRPVAQAIRALQNHPAIEYAEPNWVYQRQTTPDDPLFTSLWGMQGGFGSQATAAWAAHYTGSKEVVVGVIDEGIQVSHPDLDANIWVNPGETAGDEIDNDGNGYVDDIHGWDFYENNNTVYDGTGDDHGTHVAGTIGAIGNNSLGVVGVNWAVNMISGKFLGPNGGSTADAIEAIDYFTDLKARGVNIVALNNSWSGGGYSQALHDAIIRAAKANILFVAAAGNGNRAGRAINTDSSPVYPACYNTAVGTSTETAADYDAVISVTAIDSSGNMPRWANYGATTVDLGAPGVSITSTLPTDTYGSYNGTSMATPHVTGAIALYASTHPGAPAANIKNAILSSTAATSSLSGKTVTGGRLDLSTVITPATLASSPSAPSGLTATVISYSQIRLSWADTSDNETRFEITRTDGESDATTITVGANTASYLDSNLAPNTTYSYAISACNSAGCTQASYSAAATTPAPPVTSAVLVGTDTTTKGNWLGIYGSEGYDIALYKSPPAYGTVTVVNDHTASPHLWTGSTTDERVLRTPDGESRFAACYFQSGVFYFDVNFGDEELHRVSVYFLDWDRLGRKQTIRILDGYDATPLTELVTLESFGEGQYLTWDISGHVLIELTWIDNTSNHNAAASGIFFDPVPSRDAPPNVSITSPANGAIVSGTVQITAAASDDGGVSKVEFWVNDTPLALGTLSDGVWSLEWTPDTDGTYALTAVATDTSSQTTTSNPIYVTVDNVDDPPTVSITSPANGATVSGTVSVTANAYDDDAVTQVEFFVNGTSIGVDTQGIDGWSGSWDSTPVSDGTYTLTAVATDTSSQTTTSSPVHVTVANTTSATVHCGDLDGVASSLGSNWRATVTVTIHDATHTTVSGATVTGSWSDGTSGTVSGMTTDGGTVSFTTGSLAKRIGSVTFTITDVTVANLTYDPTANHDPDGDSDGTSITITKP